MRFLRYERTGPSLRTYTFSLIERDNHDLPQYAILSHRWGSDEDEVSFLDVQNGTAQVKMSGYKKLEFCASQAIHDGLTFFWVDTCCIDKRNSTELTEAINSMYKWYKQATKCYVYLPDVSIVQDWKLEFQHSEWFKRGWTLQELIAPRVVEFYSIESVKLGDKETLLREIRQITGISIEVLKGRALTEISEQERLSWVARRKTTKEEDIIYCLLGIFDVYMSLYYSEGRQKAWDRLRRKIRKASSSNDSIGTSAPWALLNETTRPLGLDNSPSDTVQKQPIQAGPQPNCILTDKADVDFEDTVDMQETQLDVKKSDHVGTYYNAKTSPDGGLKPSGWTVLHGAAKFNSIAGVIAILDMGHNPNVQTDAEGWSPLYIAACYGFLEISRLLLDAGADVNITTTEGSSALKEAAQIGAVEIVRLLINRGANIELAPHPYQDTPLLVASAKNYVDVVKILLANDANPRAQQTGGWSALHYALFNKNDIMALLLLDYLPDVNASTQKGLRPLHLAAHAGFTDICARLLDLGALKEARDSGGLTAMRVAVQEEHFETVQLLVDRGSNFEDDRAEDGYNSIEMAQLLGNVEIYRCFKGQKMR